MKFTFEICVGTLHRAIADHSHMFPRLRHGRAGPAVEVSPGVGEGHPAPGPPATAPPGPRGHPGRGGGHHARGQHPCTCRQALLHLTGQSGPEANVRGVVDGSP